MKISVCQKKKKSAEMDPRFSEIAKKLVTCDQNDLVRVIDSIDTTDWKESDFFQWVEVFNRFDTILESAIANNVVLALGELTPAQKKEKTEEKEARKLQHQKLHTTPDKKEHVVVSKKSAEKPSSATNTTQLEKDQKTKHAIIPPVNIAFNAKLIEKVLWFTAFLLRHVKKRDMYNSIMCVVSLLNSEHVSIVNEAMNVLLVAVQPKPGKDSMSIFDGHRPILRKLLYLSYGFGNQSLVETLKSQLDKEVIKRGCALNFNYYTDMLPVSSSGRGKKKLEKEVQKSRQGNLHTLEFEDICSEGEDSFTIFKNIITTHNIPVLHRFSLWTRIRQTFSFPKFEDRFMWNEIRLKAISILAYGDRSTGSLAKLFDIQPTFIAELIRIVESKETVPQLQQLALTTLIALASSPSRTKKITAELIPTGSNSYSGFLSKMLTTLIETLQVHPTASPSHFPLTSNILELISTLIVTEEGAATVQDSGILAQLVQLLTIRKPGFDILVKEILEVLQTTCSYEGSITTIIQAGVVKEIVAIIHSSIESVMKPAIAEQLKSSERAKPLKELINDERYKILILALQVLRTVVSARSQQVSTRELIDGPLLHVFNHILDNPTFYRGAIFHYSITLFAYLINNEPQLIQHIVQSGTLSIFLKLLSNSNLVPDIYVIRALPPLLGSLCLNNTVLDEISKTSPNPFVVLCNTLADEKYANVITAHTAKSLGKDLNEFMRHHPQSRDSIIEAAVVTITKLLERFNNSDLLKLNEQGELSDASKIFSKVFINCCQFIAEMIGKQTDHGKIFIEKGGLSVSLKLVTNCVPQTKEFVEPLILIFRNLYMSNHSATLLKELMSMTVEQFDKLLNLKLMEETDDSTMKQVFTATLFVSCLLALLEQNNARFISEWQTAKGREFLQSISKIESKIRWLNAARLVLDRQRAEFDNEKQRGENNRGKEKLLEASSKDTALTVSTQFSNIVRNLYESLQRAVFQGAREEQGETTLHSRAIARDLAHNFVRLISDFASYSGPLEQRSFYLQGISMDIYNVLVNDRHNNINTLILNEFNKIGGIDALVNVFGTFSLQILQEISEGNLQSLSRAQEKTKDEPINDEERQPTEYEKAMLSISKLALKCVNLNFYIASPITGILLASVKPEDAFEPVKIVKLIQAKFAKPVYQICEHSDLMKLHSTFILLLANIVAYIGNGVPEHDQIEPLTKMKIRSRTHRINENAISQLTEFGFSRKKAEEALIISRNDVNTALDWLLANPEPEQIEEQKDSVDDDELEAAIRLSLQGSASSSSMEADIDYVAKLKDNLHHFAIRLLPKSKRLAIAASDLVTIYTGNSNERVIEVVKQIDLTLKESSNNTMFEATVALLEHLAKKPELADAVVQKDINIVDNMLLWYSKSLEYQEHFAPRVLISCLTFMNILLRTRKIGVEKKITLETMSAPKESYLTSKEKQRLFQLCLRTLDLNESLLTCELVETNLKLLIVLTKNIELANMAKAAGIIDKLLLMPKKLKTQSYTKIVEKILKQLCEDNEVSQMVMEGIITKRYQQLKSQGRVQIRNLVQETLPLYNQNAEIYFKSLKTVCYIKNGNGVELRTLEKRKIEIPNNVIEVLSAIICQLLTWNESIETIEEQQQQQVQEKEKSKQSLADKRPALEQYHLINIITSFILTFKCSLWVAQFKHDMLEAYGGPYPFVSFIISEFMRYPLTIYKRHEIKEEEKNKINCCKMATYMLTAMCSDNLKLVIEEVVTILRNIPVLPAPIHSAHSIGEFVMSLFQNRANRDRNVIQPLAKQMANLGLTNALADSIGSIDLNHPEAPEATAIVLRSLEILSKATGGMIEQPAINQENKESKEQTKEEKEIDNIDFDYSAYSNEMGTDFEQIGRRMFNSFPISNDLDNIVGRLDNSLGMTSPYEEIVSRRNLHFSVRADNLEPVRDMEEEEEEEDEEEEEREEEGEGEQEEQLPVEEEHPEEEQMEEDQEANEQIQAEQVIIDHATLHIEDHMQEEGEEEEEQEEQREEIEEIDISEDENSSDNELTRFELHTRQRHRLSRLSELLDVSHMNRNIQGLFQRFNPFLRSPAPSLINQFEFSYTPVSIEGNRRAQLRQNDIFSVHDILLGGSFRGRSDDHSETLHNQDDSISNLNQVVTDLLREPKPERSPSQDKGEKMEDNLLRGLPDEFGSRSIADEELFNLSMDRLHSGSPPSPEELPLSSPENQPQQLQELLQSHQPEQQVQVEQQAQVEQQIRVEQQTQVEQQVQVEQQIQQHPSPQEPSQGAQQQSAQPLQATPANFPIDPSFLSALPADIRQEMIANHMNVLITQSNNQNSIPPEFIAALPPAIQAEVLEQERLYRQRHPRISQQPQQSSAPQQIDTAAFIASLSADLRMDALLQAEEDVIAQLPPNLVLEARNIRNALGTRPGRRLMPRRHPNADPMFTSLGTFKRAQFGEDEKKGTPLLTEKEILMLFRLLYLNQFLGKSHFEKVLASLCNQVNSRETIVDLLISILENHCTEKNTIERLNPILRNKLFGPSASDSFTLEFTSPDEIPEIVLCRILEALSHLSVHNQRALHHLCIDDANLKSDEEVVVPAVPSSLKTPISRIVALLYSPHFATNKKLLRDILAVVHVATQFMAMLRMTLSRDRKKCKDVLKVREDLVRDNQNTTSASLIEAETRSKPNEEQKETKTPSTHFTKIEEELQKLKQEKHDLVRKLKSVLNYELIKQVVQVLIREDCSDEIAKLSISVMTNISKALPDCRKIILRELAEISRIEGHEIVKLLDLTAKRLEKLPMSQVADEKTAERVNKFCRILQTYVNVLKNNDKKKPNELVSVGVSNLLHENSMDSVWDAAETFICLLSKEEDTTKLSVVLLARILPLIEAFFAYQAAFITNNDQATKITADDQNGSSLQVMEMILPMEPQTPKTSSNKSNIEMFLERNRKLLNAIIRANPSLLHTTLHLFTKYPKYVDFDNKRTWFRHLIQKEQRNNGQLPIRVHRNRLFDDSFRHLDGLSPDDLKQRIHVSFEGEQGIDAGALTREWFLLLSRDLLNPNYGLFQLSPNKVTMQVLPSSSTSNPDHLRYFKFIGQVIAMAIYNGQLLDCYFTRSMYKHILGIPLSFHDIESSDPDFYKNLKGFLASGNAEDACLVFAAESEDFGSVKTVELKPNGKEIPVTNENKYEYARLMAEHKMTNSIRQQLQAFLKGFYGIIPRDIISIFNDQELELVMTGLPEIDFTDLKRNTEYHGYSVSSPVIVWFWNVLLSFDKEQKCRFLQFVTGTSKVPLGGFANLTGNNGLQKFSIHRADGEGGRLPLSHACFNQLDLPEYESEELLRAKLVLAVMEASEGFGAA